MNQKTKRIRMVGAFVVSAALAVTGALVSAQSSSDPSDGAASSAGLANGAVTTSFLSRVAQNLGIDESKLAAAIRTAQEQTVDEALAAGRIIAEQAAAMEERLAAEKAMEELVADGVASGRITQEQAGLAGGRGAGMGIMDPRGPVGRRAGADRASSCSGCMERGTGR